MAGPSFHRLVCAGDGGRALGIGDVLPAVAAHPDIGLCVPALAYPIGGTFHVPHGLSNALVLPHVLRFNAPVAAPLYAEIAHDAFPHLERSNDTDRLCTVFIDSLADLSSRLGMDTRLRDVGIPESALDKMAADAMLQQRLLVNNPRELDEADALAIYREAW